MAGSCDHQVQALAVAVCPVHIKAVRPLVRCEMNATDIYDQRRSQYAAGLVAAKAALHFVKRSVGYKIGKPLQRARLASAPDRCQRPIAAALAAT